MMKYFKSIKSGLLAAAIFAAAPLFTSCEDDIDVGSSDGSIYDNVDGVYGYVKNVFGAKEPSTLTLFGSGKATAQVYFELSETATSAVNVQFTVDQSALDAYNTANGTSYTMYPASSVTFENSGNTTIAANEIKSGAVNITVNAGGSVGSTYALPVTATVTGSDIPLSKTNESYIFLVKPYPAIPDSDKGTGIKNIIYIEVNDENILNVGEYTMKSSGKPFFDVVNIFAANINYNNETGRVYLNCNDNVSYILQNAEQLIRPLQAKGIKVVLTILGNHDEAGVSNLSKEAAADFARELKYYVDVYGLDGIDFDDEYSKYVEENPSPGLELSSREAAARLVYETRKLMPDKIVSFYDFTSGEIPTGSIDGIQVGEMLDYSYWGAYANWTDTRYTIMTGLEKSQYGPSSFNLDFSTPSRTDNGRGGYNLEHASRLRPEGWGIQMYYNLKPQHYDYSGAFNKLARILFDDDVEWTGKVYEKTSFTSTDYIPPYELYLGTWTLAASDGLFWYTPGPWWDWKDDVVFTLRIEEHVAGESYKVYGWENDDTLPFIMNYNKFGRVEVNMPQTVVDDEGVEWQYVARNTYSFASYMTDTVEPAFQGYINSNGNFVMRGLRNSFTPVRTISAVQIENSRIVDRKGGLYQDVAYGPFSLSR